MLGLLLAATFFACYQPLWDPDSFWHLAVGRQIWTEGKLARADEFSFTAVGRPWEDTWWLFHTITYPLWAWGGDRALSFLTAIAGVLSVGLLYWCVRLEGGNAMLFGFYLIPFLPAIQDRVRFRPELASLIFAPLLLGILLRWRPKPPKVGALPLYLALLFGLWVQLHGAWSYGLVLVGAFLLGEALDALRRRELTPRYLLALAGTGGAPVLALFVNPYGWRAPWFPIKSILDLRSGDYIAIAEWGHTPWERPYILAILGLLMIGAGVILDWRKAGWKEAFWASSQVFLGVYLVRHLAFSALACGPLAMRLIRHKAPALPASRIGWGFGLFLVVLASAHDYSTRSREWDLSHRYPVQETQFLAKENIHGNVLNEYVAGGYLDLYGYPKLRVFMDGRYFPFLSSLRDYWKSLGSFEAFQGFLKRYPIQIALYPYPDFTVRPKGGQPGDPARGPSVFYFPKEEWALVEFGNYGMVFLKRGTGYDDVIKRLEYAVLRPDDIKHLAWAVRGRMADVDKLAMEARRKLSEDPLTSWREPLQELLPTAGGKP